MRRGEGTWEGGDCDREEENNTERRRGESPHPFLVSHTCGSRACRSLESWGGNSGAERHWEMQSARDATRWDEETRYSRRTESSYRARSCSSTSTTSSRTVVHVNATLRSRAWQATRRRKRWSSGTRRTHGRGIALIGEEKLARVSFVQVRFLLREKISFNGLDRLILYSYADENCSWSDVKLSCAAWTRHSARCEHWSRPSRPTESCRKLKPWGWPAAILVTWTRCSSRVPRINPARVFWRTKARTRPGRKFARSA